MSFAQDDKKSVALNYKIVPNIPVQLSHTSLPMFQRIIPHVLVVTTVCSPRAARGGKKAAPSGTPAASAPAAAAAASHCSPIPVEEHQGRAQFGCRWKLFGAGRNEAKRRRRRALHAQGRRAQRALPGRLECGPHGLPAGSERFSPAARSTYDVAVNFAAGSSFQCDPHAALGMKGI